MKDLIAGLFGLVFGISLIYGGYWVTKNLSYTFFYQDLVETTIADKVKPSCLI